MKTRLDTLQAGWQARSPGERSAAKVLATGAALLILAQAWFSLEAEQAQLQKAWPLAQARLQRMQDDAGEVARLRAQSGARTTQPATAEAINASLRSRHLDLVATADGSDRLQIHGNADFDETIAWLAIVHQDFKLRLEMLSATHAGKGVRIDAVLVAPTSTSP
jgi:type II secretory pathway component PulM